jgi:hypothetical protein
MPPYRLLVYLAPNDQMEALSRAYVGAIAARAGYDVTRPEVDRDSVDLIVSAKGDMRPQINMQAKATTGVSEEGEQFSFQLKIKNYNDLKIKTQVPRLLVVLALPNDDADWIHHSPERLLLRRCAYWKSLLGMPETDKGSIAIHIEKANIFDVPTLRALMEKSRSGTPL